MKNYLTLSIFLLCSIALTAQNQEFKVKKGHYIFEELGGYGLPALMTLGYEQVNPINDYSFLSSKIGVNGSVWFFGHSIGVPHGVSMNFGKKHVFLETGVNGWFGYYEDQDDLSNIKSDYIYVIGTNVGVNTAFRFLKTDVMLRAYLNPSYNLNSDLIRKTYVFGGLGMSFRLGE